jgi:hypothetical protein
VDDHVAALIGGEDKGIGIGAQGEMGRSFRGTEIVEGCSEILG